MKVILATGIYPPEIGGPATYCRALAEEFSKRGWDVIVVTYARKHQAPSTKHQKNSKLQSESWSVISISKTFPIIRWFLYARTLRTHAHDADAVIAFSSVSAGVPLWLAHLKKPKKILRLGGDFFWERYTDRRGMKGLRAWYESKTTAQQAANWVMNTLLRKFDHIVFSTEFQKKIYEENYWGLSLVSVIENAVSFPSMGAIHRRRSSQLKLLFMGRFVGFKNLEALVEAVGALRQGSGQAPHAMPLHSQCMLTFVGDGPMKARLQSLVQKLNLESAIHFLAPVHGQEKTNLFEKYDLMIIPSLTEISPNVALEADDAGLPVLLTEQTGLSPELSANMVLKDLSTSQKIVDAIEEMAEHYDQIAHRVSSHSHGRSTGQMASDWIRLLSRL